MIQNRTAQLIFQTVYCTLGVVGTIASFGIFDDITRIRWDFYLHFTNLSNYLCLGIMFAELNQTVRKRENSFVSTAPLLKFIGLLAILLTFLVFNLLLANAEGRDPKENWKIASICFHEILPLMYLADWFLFYERRTIRWYDPLIAAGFPLLYVFFIFSRAALLPEDTAALVYPYFFLDVNKQGVAGTITWVMYLLAAFTVGGYLFFGIDRICKMKKSESGTLND